MKLNKIASLLFVAASAFSASAMAETVSFDLSTIASTKTDFVQSLSFLKFDNTLGTLSSVQFDVYSAVDASVKLTNLTPLNKNVQVTLSTDMFFSVPGAPAQSLLGSIIFDETVRLGGSVPGQPRTTATVGNSALLHGVFGFSSDLGLFSGVGDNNSMAAPLSVVASSSSLGNSGVSLNYSTYANAYGTVTYTYTAAPVPEPETYGMLLLGLGILGVAAKRKARASQA